MIQFTNDLTHNITAIFLAFEKNKHVCQIINFTCVLYYTIFVSIKRHINTVKLVYINHYGLVDIFFFLFVIYIILLPVPLINKLHVILHNNQSTLNKDM